MYNMRKYLLHILIISFVFLIDCNTWNWILYDTKRFGHTRPDIKFYTTKVNLYFDDPLEFKDYISKIKEEVKNQLINCL